MQQVATVKEMKIDEEKQYGVKKLEKNTATNKCKKIYSDHNTILINLDFETSTATSIKTVQRTGTKNPRKNIKEHQKICKRYREEYSTTI